MAALVSLFPLHAQIQFEEIHRKAGLAFQLQNGATGQFHQIELMAGGVAALDFDGDGCTDLFFANGAGIPDLRKSGPKYHNRLYRNNCDGTFTDVTAKAGLAGEGYSIAVATADFDNDGWPDIFVGGVNGNILYRNRGDGTFENVTVKAGLSGTDPKLGKMWAVSAGWFDYDNDGWLDLFVVNYVAWDPATEPQCGAPDARFYCHPNAYRGLPNQLFHNNRDGTFTDVSRASGIAQHIGKGMGVAFADFDGDGFIDVFVANDSVRNFLFRNRGDGTFQEMGLEAGIAFRQDGAAIAGMGADFRDFDNDGLPDLVVSGMINDGFQLFRNLGKRRLFEDVGQASGLLAGTRQMTGWSLGMYDFDNDGWKDLFFALSHFPALDRYLGRPSALPNQVFRNVSGNPSTNAGGRRFQDVSATAGPGFQHAALHHGAAFADFDNDGRIDVVVTTLEGPVELLHNISKSGNHWLAVKLRGHRSNRQGLGAVVRVQLPDGRVLYGHATTSVGYASSSEPLVRFGLGTYGEAKTVEVRWPSGETQVVSGVKGDRVVEIEEAEAHK
ncbi:MAG TPA: CRTAC1 family protein [Candidatus Acidoferrales bacterium]|nr:CRTAC1 family protein [Candidatus Acidoferrales bacterium]